MLTKPHTENRAVAQMRMRPSEKPSSEIVCLVDDDPLALRSIGFKHVLTGSTAERVMRRANRSVLVVPSHPGLRKMSNQKNGTRLMERLSENELDFGKGSSWSHVPRQAAQYSLVGGFGQSLFSHGGQTTAVIAIIKQVRAATGPISPSSNVECLDTAHFFPDCSLDAPVPNVLPFCL